MPVGPVLLKVTEDVVVPALVLATVLSLSTLTRVEMRKQRKATWKDIGQGLRSRGFNDLTKEVVRANAGRCTIAHPSLDLPYRIAVALSEKPDRKPHKLGAQTVRADSARVGEVGKKVVNDFASEHFDIHAYLDQITVG